MRLLKGPSPFCGAIHMMLAIPPIVQYLSSGFFEQELVKKRVNAVAFATGLKDTAIDYWSGGSEVIDTEPVCQAIRRIFRHSNPPAHACFFHMFQVLLDAVAVPGNVLSELGTEWLTHDENSVADSVQKLLNSQSFQSLPHLMIIRLDRGNRPRRFINYGTSCRVTEHTDKGVRLYWYDLFAVLTEGADGNCVYSKGGGTWYEATSSSVKQLEDLNRLVTVEAQYLVYLRRL